MGHSVLEDMGFAEIPGVLVVDQCAGLVTALDGAGSDRAGSRNLLDVPACQRLAATFKPNAQVGALLPQGAAADQCTVLHKSAANHPLYPLPQELTTPIPEPDPHAHDSGWPYKD